MTRPAPRSIESLLEEGLSPLSRKLCARLTRRLVSQYAPFAATETATDGERRVSPTRSVAAFLLFEVGESHTLTQKLGALQDEFNQRHTRALSDGERRDHALAFAKALGATRRQLAGDARAFSRWFDYEAVRQRCVRRIAQLDYSLTHMLDRLGAITARALAEAPDPDAQLRLWRKLRLESALAPLLRHTGDARVRIQAFRTLAVAIRALDASLRESSLQESTLALIYRSCLDSRQDVWIQCEALSLLRFTAPDQLVSTLDQRLRAPHPGDDLFVRRRAVVLLDEAMDALPRLIDLIPVALTDPSPFVRQALCKPAARLLGSAAGGAHREAARDWMERLAHEDAAPEVRATALLEVPALFGEAPESGCALMNAAFTRETSPFVLRAGLTALTRGLARLMESPEPPNGRDRTTALLIAEALSPALSALHTGAPDLSVRRWSAQALNALFVETTPAARELMQTLKPLIEPLGMGQRRRLPAQLIHGQEEPLLGRVLCHLAQEGFTLSLHRGLLGTAITRGDRFGFRLWRVLHELRHPSPDKRQGHPHTRGRHLRGTLIAPTSLMGELTRTKVPGEPLFMATESGWRPFLPLPDHLLSSLKLFRRTPFRLFTPEGVTEVRPPRTLVKRAAAIARLTLAFDRYATLRNWQEQGLTDPATYVRQLEHLGFALTFNGHASPSGRRTDPKVARFFPAILPLHVTALSEPFHEYLVSIYGNSLYELGFFALLLLLLFLGGHLRKSRSLRKARATLDLVIGGWGTRGKSGTERLKAALFESMGHGYVSKSTGCEAMFLHAPAFGTTQEMFLFRPYDKATIWEHHQLMHQAVELGAGVFLWECMGLTPPLVRILQRQWSRDDFSTLTNAYPDHEDIQGPAGYDIPLVMGEFIPRKGHLITSEEQMHPILKWKAQEAGTPMESVGWLEAGLLPADLLARFPYEEHPHNVALVLAMADALGLERDRCVKEMADRVIGDIGVLKDFPRAAVGNRHLSFVNGMSANDRFGTLSNWTRMGFDTNRDPSVVLSTLINNRADRISRSIMFASLIVEEISADLHFLIGTNLKGLLGYINQALARHTGTLTLFPEAGTQKETSRALFFDTARRARVPVTDEAVRQKLGAMISGVTGREAPAPLLALWQDPDRLLGRLAEALPRETADEIHRFHTAHLRVRSEALGFIATLEAVGPSDRPRVDRAFRQLVTSWMLGRLVVIDDAHATGDQIIHRIARATPPGVHNRIMGMQNIKGTGLDFVYRWQAWETCHAACTRLRERDAAAVQQGLKALSAFQEHGLLTDAFVRETLAELSERTDTQTEAIQAELAYVAWTREKKMAEVTALLQSDTGPKRGQRLLAALANALEAFLDAGDAVKRRKTANRIYTDLANERISHERAAMELKALNQRQKGGWLLKGLTRRPAEP